jgi:hypothetical protein
VYVFDFGRQCVCGNDRSCKVIFWNSHLTVEENAADAQFIQFPSNGAAS